MDQFISKRTYLLLFLFCGFVYFLGFFFPLFDPDPNKYAGIAMRICQNNDFVNLISRHEDNGAMYEYLDKPHLLFWLAAFSFKLFGFYDWAYRLPSVLFTVLAAYSTFGLGRALYNKEVGRMAALIFATSYAIILANHDVRTDSLLTSTVIFGIWQLIEFIKQNKLINIILGAVGIALGVSTKGMIALFVAGIAIFCYLLYSRQWKSFFNWKLLIGIAAFFATLFPVLYCYYLQFDLHPEKLVNGQFKQSGVSFLFWTQSFERLAGERALVTSPEYSFFFHTLLWAILPWSLLAYISVFGRAKEIWKTHFKPVKGVEFLTLGGVVIVFIVISYSKFKLPHYLNILFPLFAILMASYLYNLVQKTNSKLLNVLEKIQLFIIGLLIIIALVVNYWMFPVQQLWISIVAFIAVTVLFFIVMRGSSEGHLYRIIIPSAFSILGLAFLLNANFYPQVLHYQAGSTLAHIAKENNISPNKTFIFGRLYYSFDFYSNKTIPELTPEDIKAKNAEGTRFYLFVTEKNFTELQHLRLKVKRKFEAYQYPVTRLRFDFLNPSTRTKTLNKVFLVEIN
ncbi:ArnT family glycosyltransferase [Solitalea lacus]|uniref:ArnT family glycosyltransferase n=1 Tax=Solitalea lacus TaxID=2911172 RepID=UPI001EDC5AD6|nr:glycosyltransferase family 39 protein [Solitalea lacus]UKJ07272.1 glycosyltransferase family 39 protein [Solitalea lacus]